MTKICRQCGDEKPLSEFYAHKKAKDRLQSECKDCSRFRLRQLRDPQKDADKQRRWREANPDKAQDLDRRGNRRRYVEHRFGISVEKYDEIMAAADSCAICGRPDRLVLDHCHLTSAIREVLCSGCNVGLGFFRDDPVALRAAAAYVETHKIRFSEASEGTDTTV